MVSNTMLVSLNYSIHVFEVIYEKFLKLIIHLEIYIYIYPNARINSFSILVSLKQQKSNHFHKMKTLFKILEYFFSQFGNNCCNSFIQSYQRGINFLET